MDLDKWGKAWNISNEALQDLRLKMGIDQDQDQFLDRIVIEGNETVVTKKIRMEAANDGILLWRNNLGAYKDDYGNFIRYGLANDSAAMNKRVKSSDLIGIKPNGQFIAREVKASGWKFMGRDREVAQLRFIELVLSKGGDAAFSTGEL